MLYLVNGQLKSNTKKLLSGVSFCNLCCISLFVYQSQSGNFNALFTQPLLEYQKCALHVITGYLRSSWTKLNSYFRQTTIHGVRNVICACSFGHDICVFTFRMNFDHRGWPSKPPTVSSNSTKITKNAQF